VIGLLRAVQALCVVLSLPGSAQPRRLESGAAHGAAISASWIDAIRAKAGSRPALLIWVDARLVAEAPDGAQLGSLAGIPAGAVALDPRMELVWIRQPDRLLVLDLRVPEPKPEIIATKLAGALDFEVRVSRRDTSFATVSRFCEKSPGVVLKWSTNPKLTSGDGKLVGRRWLASNRDRALIEIPELQNFDAESGWDDDRSNGLEPVQLPSRKRCQDEQVCGRFQYFGKLGWQLVLVGNRWDACPGSECMMLDPDRRKFATPPANAPWGTFEETKPGSCGPYRFDRSQVWYFSVASLCKLGGACRALPGRALGWVDPGPVIGDPD
jgi:hypothetical protein